MPQLSRDHHRLLERFTASLGVEVRDAPRLLIAVSGGADSLALLELSVLARGPRAAADVTVYIDHGLRPEAAEEAEHVRSAAHRLGTGFALVTLDGVGPDEGGLREARYAELQTLAKIHAAEFVLTGHTRDDQVETVLHRLMRGAGRFGLAGIPERRGNLVRPLLGFGRDEIRRFLRERGIAWREDGSNSDLRYLRNRLRHRVVPVIQAEFGSGALDHLPAMAAAWRDEEAYLESEATRYGEFALVGPATARRLDARALQAAPAALRSRIIRAWLASRTGRRGTSFSRSDTAAVLALAHTAAGTRRAELDRATVVNAYGVLDVTVGTEANGRTDPAYRLEVATRTDAQIAWPGGWVIEVRNLTSGQTGFGPDQGGTVVRDRGDFDRDLLGETLIVRSALPGDRIRATHAGSKKVSDLLIDARIPRAKRRGWPVVEANGRILWVPGVARSADFAAAREAVARLRLTWRRELA